MDERDVKIEEHRSGLSPGLVTLSSHRKMKDKARAGFAIAPILYMLGLIGVGAAVLFSGYSQILRTNSNITNGLEAKNDLNGNATTMSATSVLSADTTVLCPPTAAYNETTNCSTATTPPPTKMAALAGQTQLPANTSGVAGSGGSAPREVGVFTAGSGMKQLDPWGHYYIVCRWENLTSPGSSPAFMIISGGPDGSLQTKCTDTAAQGDDLIIEWPVTVAVNRSAVWQATTTSGGTSQVQFGQVGTQLVVDSSGDLTTPGNLTVGGTSNLQSLSATSITDTGALTAGSISTTGNISGNTLTISGNGTIGGTFGVTGATSLSALSTSGAATLNSAAITNNATVGGTLGVTGATSLGSLSVAAGETVSGTLGVTGATSLSTLSTSGAATLNSAAITTNETVGGTLGVTGATSLSTLTTTGNVGIGGNLTVAGTTSLTGALSGSSATFTGSVTAANFIGATAGGSIVWGAAIVPLANGGTSYAASSPLDLLGYLGGTNASNLSLGTIPSGRIAAGEITSAMMAAPDVSTEVGPYYQVYVDSAGRVVTGSGTIPVANEISDGVGEYIVADNTNGLTFDTSNTLRMRVTMGGLVGIGTGTPAVSLDMSKETDALALPSGTMAQRPSAPINGEIRYNTDSTVKDIEAYVNGAWSQILVSGGSGGIITSGVYLGTSASSTNPQRASDVTTGLFSPAVGTVSVSSGGVEIERTSANGVAIGTTYAATSPPTNGAIIQGKVGLGTSTVTNALDVNGSVAVGTLAGTVSGGSNELIVGGNVGIGTASPSSLLHIVDSSAQTTSYKAVEIAASETSGTASMTKTGVDIQSTGTWNGTGATNVGLNVNVSGGTTNYAALFNGGNVGIGTTSPSQLLVLQATNPYIELTNGTNSWGASVGVAGANNNFLIRDIAQSANRLQIDTSGNMGLGGTITNAAFAGATMVLNTGSVGIGSASPQVSLDMNLKTDAAALPSGLLGQRPSGINGEIRYSQTDNAMEVYVNGAWEDLITSGGSTSGINLGTSAGATNPHRTGEVGTGLFSATSGTVSIADLGSDLVDFSATGPNILGTLSNGSYSIGYKINGNNAVWQDAANFDVAVGPTAFPTTVVTPGGNVGQDNTAVGYQALNANITGRANSAFGSGALAVDTTGGNNTAIGYGALTALTTGSSNTAVGSTALNANVTGLSNTAVGAGALQSNTANSNTAVGTNSLLNNTTGTTNTALGGAALNANTTGSNNVAVGSTALLHNTTGVNNTALGYQAGYGVTTGGHNIILGDYGTTGGITTGSSNILIGQDLQELTATSSNQLDIGNLIYATGLNSGSTMSTGLIGIGSTTPNSSLDISQRTDAISLPSGSTAQRPSSAVNGMIRYNNTGGITTAEGYFNNAWQQFVTTGTGGTSAIYLGTSASTTNPQRNGDAMTGLFSPATGTVSVASGGNEIERISANGVAIGTSYVGTAPTANGAIIQGNVGIGNTAPGEKLEIGSNDSTDKAVKIRYSTVPAYMTSSYDGSTYAYNGISNNFRPTGNTYTVPDNSNYGNLLLSLKSGTGSSKFVFSYGAPSSGVPTVSDLVTIQSGGNVGIGTATPATQLHVVGGLDLSGTATGLINKIVSITGSVSGSSPAGFYYTPTITGTSTGSAQGMLLSPSYVNSSGGTVAEFDALNISAVGISGANAVTNGYGLVVAAPTGASNNYAAYFNGKVGVGSASPQVSLDLNVETDALALPSGLITQRPAGINGEIRYTQSGNALEAYVNGAWENLVTSGGSTSVVNLGTSSSATNPQRTSEATTGLYSLNSGEVDLAVITAGQIMKWTSAGQNIISGTLTVNNNGIISSPSSATLHLGAADAASPVAQTLGVQNVVAGTTNTAGANLTISGSQGTGTGAGGSILFQTAPAGSTGSTQNAEATAMTITSAGSVGIGTSPASILDIAVPSTSPGIAIRNASGVVVGGAIRIENSSGSPLFGIGLQTSSGSSTSDLQISNFNGSSWTNAATIQSSTGNVGIGNTSPGAKLDIGLAGTTEGTMRLEGSTSGYTQVQANITAGSWTLTLPPNAGTNTYVLQTDGSGNTSWVPATSGSAGLTLGTSAAATNPQRSGQIGTGLFSATSNTVSIADNSADVMDVAVTGPNILGTITQGSYSIGYQINGNNAVWQDATNENLAVGATALPTTVSPGGGNNGLKNLAVGYQALNANTTGYQNIAIGVSALTLNTTGYQNIAIGVSALSSNTTGTGNTAVGAGAVLGSNSTGSSNTGVGTSALLFNTTGSSNTAVGSGAMEDNTTGGDNTAMGFDALFNNVTGQYNTALGYQALQFNISGTDNTAVGYQAMLGITGAKLTGQYNTGIGDSALYVIQGAGAKNTTLGYKSGYAVTTGTDNTLVGYESGLGVTGNSNIIVGEDTASAITSGGSNILIGNSLSGLTNTASNQINIGNTITGALVATSGGTALVIGTTTDDGAIMTFAGDGAITLPDGTTAQRPSAPANGMIRYNADSSGAVEAYVNGAWEALITSGGSTSTITLGTSAAVTNPQRSGEAGTGFFSATDQTVAVAANGVEVEQWNTIGSGNTYVSITPGATAAPTIGVGGTSAGLILNAGAGALTLETTGSNGAIDITPNGTGPVILTSGVTTGTGATAGLEEAYNSLTTGNGEDISSSSLTSGNLVKMASTSTAGTASGSDTVLNIARSGANANTAHTAYGIQSSVTNTNATSGTNIAAYLSASGATTANYGLIVANGNVGIGTASPTAKMEVVASGLYTSDYGTQIAVHDATTYSKTLDIGYDGTNNIGYIKAVNSGVSYSPIILNAQGGNIGIANTSPNAKLDIGSTGTLGTMRLEGSTSGYVQIQPLVAAGSWTLTLPSSAGSPNYILQTDGSGNTSWVALGGSGTALNLGTSASATNPQRTGQAGTGFYSDTSNEVEVAINGVNLVTLSASAENIAGTITQGSYSIGYKINGTNAIWQDDTNFNLAVGNTAFPTIVNPSGGACCGNGQANVAMGYQALNADTTGQRNAAVGYQALAVNTTGASNAAFGYIALSANTTGTANVAVGAKALASNTVGVENTAVGNLALTTSTTASTSTAIGYAALTAATIGQQNTAVGAAALTNTTTGSGNTAVGLDALDQNTTGINNTALGYLAGYDVTTGGHNVIIGDYVTTGVGITTGSNNILIGQNLQELTNTSSNQLDIGNLIFATGLASGTTMSTGNVGIGTNAPNTLLHIEGTSNTGIRLNNTTASTGKNWLINSHPTKGTLDIYSTSASVEPASFSSDGTLIGLGGNITSSAMAGASMVINSGNIGIGSTTPQVSLDMNLKTDAVALPSGLIGQRPSGINGEIRYTQTGNALEAYVNGAWENIVTSTGSTSTIFLGTSAAATSPQRSGQVGTGLFSAASNTVSIADNGVDVMDVATIGPNILGTITTNSYSIGYEINGSNAVWQDATNANLAMGATAMPTTVAQGSANWGTHNVAVGSNALNANTTGYNNTAVGYNTLTANTTGTFNVAMGAGALWANTTGNNNTALGDVALDSDTTGSGNTAVGSNAMVNNTTGNYNTAVGELALYSNTTAYYNTAIGFSVLDHNTTGQYNTGLGYDALYTATTGVNNTALGYQAGYDVTTGGHNVIIGDYATTGAGITTGSNNILIGQDLRELTATTSNQLDIGNLIFATGLASGTTMSAGNVGIGNTSPGAKLDIGLAGTTEGTMRLEGSTSGYTQVQANITAGSWTLTLPPNAGTNTYVLQTDGSGNTSWVPATSGSAGLTLGTSAAATNPQRSGQIGTGLFSATSNTVSIADNSADVMDVAVTGPNILGTITQGSYSIGYQINGNNAVWQDATNENLAVGATALPTTVSPGGGNNGLKNLAVGYQALNANTTGYQNIAIGVSALTLNTTGYQNIAIGVSALSSNTTGTGNTAVGAGAVLGSNSTGSSNTGVGTSALLFNTTGSSNTALGYQALQFNISGTDNTAVGYQAMLGITGAKLTGQYNTGIGDSALYVIQGAGAKNTTLGYKSGYAVTTGTDNTLVGYESGLGVTGNSNIIVGEDTASAITSGGSNILIGNSLSGLTNTASNQINIGNTITGALVATSGGTALVIGTTTDDGAIMTFAGDGAITLPDGTTAQRPSAPANGMIRYNADSSGAVEAYVNGAWEALITSGGSTSTITLGTSAAVTNPQRSGEAGTGFFSATDQTVAVAANGVEVEQWNTIGSGNTYVSITPGATAAPTIGVGGTSAGLILNAGAGALTLETTGSNGAIDITPNGTGPVILTSGVTTGTGATAGLEEAYNSLTTGNGEDISSSSLTSGNLVKMASTSTAGTASGSDTVLNIARSGANANTAHTAYGIQSSVTNTNATSGTNIAAYLSASGATTANYGLIVANGNVGIGNTSPGAKLDIGSTGALGTMRLEGSTSGYVQVQPLAAAGSWTLTLPGSAGSPNYILQTDGSGNTSWVALGGSGTALNLGTSASATNPQRTGQAGTGFYSDTSNEVEVAINGVNLVTWSASAENIAGTITQGSYSIGYKINGNNAIWQDATNFSLAVGSTAFPTTNNPDGSARDGQFDVAVGYHALNANTTGAANVAVGANALAVNTTGTENTAVGAYALTADVGGSTNTAVGYVALVADITGQQNTAVGATALASNTGGSGNIAIGLSALGQNTTGNYNTGMGQNALYSNVTGVNNTALGFQAGYDVNGGSHNVILGDYATTGVGITTGSNNIIIGQDVRPPSQTADNQMNIGNLIYATGLASGTTASTGSVGIGTNAPAVVLDVQGGAGTQVNIGPGSGSNNAAIMLIARSSGTAENVSLVANQTADFILAPSGGHMGVSSSGTNPHSGSTFNVDGSASIGSGYYSSAAPTNGLIVQGKVGIGSASPQVSLDMNIETDAIALPSGLLAQRPSGINGELRYSQSLNALEAYVNGAWTSLVTSGGGTSTITLGTSATATNPQRSSEAGTGLFSAASGQVSVAATGTDEADFAAAGLNLPVATESYKINGVNALWQDNTNFNTAVGDTALPTTISQAGGGTKGQSNVAVGYQALNANTTGYFNTAVGSQALNVNTTGNSNTAVGNGSLAGNTGGSSNTAVGSQALNVNTTGGSNVAVGNSAMISNTTGYNNTAVGFDALYTNTTGYQNTAIGYQALYRNVTGISNVAMGLSALFNNTIGQGNVAVGNAALDTNTTGTYNTALGGSALLFNTTGNFNTAVGASALVGNTTGVNNTAVGYQAGYDVTTGGHNVIIGDYATTAVGITTGSNNILIGQDVRPASQTASNQLNFGNLLYATGLASGTTASTGNVGIGNTSPGAKLDIGLAGTTEGTMRLEGSTSGYTQVQANITAGSWTLTLPPNAGTNTYVLQTDGSGNTSWVPATSGSAGLTLGTSAAATNPQRSGQIGTGLFSATSNTVSIADNSADVMDVAVTGPNILGTITQGSYSIGYQINGNNAVWQDATNENLAVGATALPTTVSPGGGNNGLKNLAVGYQALNANTTGYQNIAIGVSALTLNTTGYQNIAIGVSALSSNTTGTGNTAVGAGAVLGSNSTGSSNTGVGTSALLFNTTGSSNTALGYQALQFNISGTDNTAVGYQAMLGITGAKLTGQYNTGIGDSALYVIQGAGAKNTTLGYKSGYAVTTGTDNTLVGYESGLGVTGNSNIIVGEDTASAITSGGSNILIGNSLSGLTNTASNQINIGNTITGALVATSGGTALVIGTTTDDGAIMTFAGDGAITLPDGTTAQRPSAPANGMIRYNADSSGAVEAYVNGAWEALITSGGSTSTITLGTSAAVTNPQRSGEAGTGFFSATDQTVAVAANGVEVEQWNTIGSGNTYVSITPGATAAPTIGVGGTSAGLILNAGAGALTLETTGSNGAIDITPNGTGPVILTSGVTTGTGATAGLEEAYNSLTTGNGEDISSSSLTSGNLVKMASTSTAGTASGSDTVLNIARSGANANTAHTAYGIQSSVTNTNATSGTNIAAYLSASGATTANYGLIVANGNVGIGNTSPGAKLDIGLAGTTEGTLRLESSTAASYVQLQASTTSGSWTMTLPSSGGTANYVLQTDGSGNTSWVALGGSGTAINLGTSAAATNPQRSGQAGTGFYSDTSNEVEVAIGGNNLVTWSASAENISGTITQGSYSIGYQINGNNAVWQDATNNNLAIGKTAFPTTVVPGTGLKGQDNLAVGSGALNANTTGALNTAVGTFTLNANTVGVNDTALGYAALYANTTGIDNTGLGFSTLANDSTGSYNTATGYSALTSVTTGYGNTAMGYDALSGSQTGQYNTAMGYQAGYDMTSGDENIIVGYYPTTAVGVTTGSNNIMVGYDVRPPSQTANNQLNIGNLIYATGLGSGSTASTGNVGIGNTSPGAKLDIGLAGTTEGTLRLESSTAASYVQLQASTTSGSWTMTLPSSGGTANYVLQTDGSGNTSWVALGGSGTAINLGTSAAATNPQRSGQAGTGFYSDTSNEVEVAIGGNNLVTWSASAENISGTITQGSYSIGYQINGNNAVWQDATNNNLAIGKTAFPTTVVPGTGLKGQDNLAVGSGALNANTTGALNTAVGTFTLNANTVGVNDTALGYAALYANTTGIDNTGLGFSTLANDSTGSYNTATGYSALTSVTTGYGNTAMGYDALSGSQTGQYNTAMGYQAGYDMTSGDENIIVGYYPTTAVGVTTGSNNIMVGYDVRPPSQTANNQLNIGNLLYATGLASGTTMSAGNVGIGTATPGTNLEVRHAGAGEGGIKVSSDQNSKYLEMGGDWPYIDSYGTSSRLLINYNSGQDVQIGPSTAGITFYYQESSGSVGIGSTTPNSALDMSQKTDAVSLPSGTSAQRPTPVNGMIRYSQTNTGVEAYYGGAWNTLSTGGAAATIYLGASAGATNPQRNGQVGTGFYSDTSNEVEVAIGGTNLVTWSASAENISGTISNGSYSIGYQINGNNAVWQDNSNNNVAVGPTAFPTTVSQTGGGSFGQGNTAVGYHALNANITGAQNTAVGTNALQNNTKGMWNVGVGLNALGANTTGYYNVAVGAAALVANVTGYYNVAMGYDALGSNTTGTQNTGLGLGALGSNTTGNNNTAVGYDALGLNNTGQYNTALGFQAGFDVTSGAENIILGYYPTTAVGVTTGSNNILLGYDVRPPSQTASNQLNIGNLIYATSLASGTSVATTGLVGIGTTAPNSSLDLSQKNDALSLPSGTSAQRPGSPVNGMIRYNQSTTGVEAYYSSTWNPLGGGGGSTINLGTSASVTNPQRTSDATTGLFSASTGTVSIAASGTDVADHNSTGINLPVATESYQLNGNNAIWQDATNFNLAVGATAFPTTVSQAGGGNNGQKNVAIGYQALNANTTGYYNTAIGKGALAVNTTGSFNTAVGRSALTANTTGVDNTGIGTSALFSDTTGQQNTAVGDQALYANTTGQNNTAIGYDVGSTTLTTGSNNILIGVDNTTDTYSSTTSTAIGIGQGVKPGTNDIAIGYQALNGAYQNGNQAVAIGYQANKGAAYASTVVGNGAMSNDGNASYSNAFGVNALGAVTTGTYNNAMGNYALGSVTTGQSNIGIGDYAGSLGSPNLITGSQNILIGNWTQPNGSADGNSIVIGYGQTGKGSNTVVLGNTSTSALYAQVTTITGLSDRRKKKDIHDIDLGLDFIDRLKPVSYRYNNGDETLRFGFIAQDVESALPKSLQEMVEKSVHEHGLALVGHDPDKERTYEMGYSELISPVVKAVQELKSRGENEKKDIADLKKQIAALSGNKKAAALATSWPEKSVDTADRLEPNADHLLLYITGAIAILAFAGMGGMAFMMMGMRKEIRHLSRKR